MIVAYIGNFVPEHSTENHVRQAWEEQGHKVVRVQEGEPAEWARLINEMARVDLVLWTRTASESARVGLRTQRTMLARAAKLGKPTVAFHLDRWWGLNREASVWEEPFFQCQYVITADGGHQAEFESVGVNHFWLPPGVSLKETELGEYTQALASDLTFVGSWQPGYHAEWTHRPDLVRWLKENYPQQMRFWPRPGRAPIRGKELRDLYASVKVVIGDSCLVGDNWSKTLTTHYWSDRIPETIGRGAFLIHPNVKGLEEHFTIGEHLWTWDIEDWSGLKQEIDSALQSPETIQEVRVAGRQHVIENHTYSVRVNQILKIAGLK